MIDNTFSKSHRLLITVFLKRFPIRRNSKPTSKLNFLPLQADLKPRRNVVALTNGFSSWVNRILWGYNTRSLCDKFSFS